MTTPIIGAPELVEGQAVPETTVNEAFRYSEQGARWFAFLDRDLATPPGSPADGDTYLLPSSATGAWVGHDGEIAFFMSTAWNFISPQAGFAGYVVDEDQPVTFDGTDWNDLGGGSTDPLATAPVHVANFTADGEVRFYADVAMTLTQQSTSGTGSVAYEKSTSAAPATFSSTTSPITLEAGAWLKITASSVTDLFAVAFKRTA